MDKDTQKRDEIFPADPAVFVATLKWALVVTTVSKESQREFLKVMTKPDKMEEKAAEYGLDEKYLVDEIIKVADKLKEMKAKKE